MVKWLEETKVHGSGSRPDIVGRLLEVDTFAGEGRGREPRLLAVDGERVLRVLPGEIGVRLCDLAANPGQRRAGQHVAAGRLPVAEDAVVEQGEGAAVSAGRATANPRPRSRAVRSR